jgi:hypothetical protein
VIDQGSRFLAPRAGAWQAPASDKGSALQDIALTVAIAHSALAVRQAARWGVAMRADVQQRGADAAGMGSAAPAAVSSYDHLEAALEVLQGCNTPFAPMLIQHMQRLQQVRGWTLGQPVPLLP